MSATDQSGPGVGPGGEVYRCTESFTTWSAAGVPRVLAAGDEVLSDDPAVKTHAQFFEPAAARLVARRVVEQATAEPGRKRARSATVTDSVGAGGGEVKP